MDSPWEKFGFSLNTAFNAVWRPSQEYAISPLRMPSAHAHAHSHARAQSRLFSYTILCVFNTLYLWVRLCIKTLNYCWCLSGLKWLDSLRERSIKQCIVIVHELSIRARFYSTFKTCIQLTTKLHSRIGAHKHTGFLSYFDETGLRLKNKSLYHVWPLDVPVTNCSHSLSRRGGSPCSLPDCLRFRMRK